MVSSEGACAAYYNFGRMHREAAVTLRPRSSVGRVTVGRRRGRTGHAGGSVCPAWSKGSGSGPSSTAWPPSSSLAGQVGNDADGVFVEVEGPTASLERFCARLVAEAPPLARVDAVEVRRRGARRLRRVPHRREPHAGAVRTFVSPDVAVCDDCLAELFDPERPPVSLPVHQLHQLRAPLHHHPAPALRPAEHHDGRLRHVPGVRRRVPRPGRPPLPRPADRVRRLRAPALVRTAARDRVRRHRRRAGGRSSRRWPTAGSWRSRASAATTWPATPRRAGRRRGCASARRRPQKPFAVMVRDAEAARRLAEVGAGEQRAARAPAAADRPARRRRIGRVARRSSPRATRRVGVLLPYTPLHHLLFAPVPGVACARCPRCWS